MGAGLGTHTMALMAPVRPWQNAKSMPGRGPVVALRRQARRYDGMSIASIKGRLRRSLTHLPLYRHARSFQRRWLTPAYSRRVQENIAFHGEFVSEGSLCIDIGANVGIRTECLLALGASVVAVEPQPACVDELRAMFGHLDRFSLEPQACGSSPGTGNLCLADWHLVATMSPEWRDNLLNTRPEMASANWHGEQQVPVTTLDELIKKYGVPHYIKIDVEGYEAEVFRGLSQPLPWISFEVSPWAQAVATECFDILSALGTPECNYVVGEQMRWCLDRWYPLDEMQALVHDDFFRGESYADVYLRFDT